MKRKLFFIVLLIAFKSIAQNNSKIAFQKGRYDLALSYYKKADFKKAIDLFSVASKIKPDNEIGQESIKKVDSIKMILRESIMSKALGTWKMIGDKPIWAVSQTKSEVGKDFDEIVEITPNEISFYEKNKKNQVKKLIKTEKVVYYNKEASDSLYSDIILSDGTIWNCTINDASDQLHAINVGKTGEEGVEKIDSNNLERFYVKVK